MNLASFSVQRYQFTIVAFGMLAALGISSLIGIPKAEDPTFPIASFNIVAIYPGASPADLEKLVVDPIEERLKTLDDLKDLKTEIGDGLAVLQPEFVAGSDADKKYDDVLREVNALRPKLPAALQSLDVKRFNAANVSVIEVALVSETASYRELGRLAEQLKKRLENLPGVKDSARWATPHEQVRVSLDLPRLSALGFSPFQVIGALQNTNVNIPAGSVEMGGRKFNVKTSGDYASVEEVRDTVVGAASGALVRVGDVATVAIQDEDQNDWGRFNGKRAVFVTATQKEGENIFNVRRRIQGALDAFQPRLPADVKLAIGFDQEKNVSHRLTGFTRDFLLAIALVLLTLLPLGLRASAIVMISIPLSLAIGVAALRYAGFSINQLSIVGFVIALGLLVDDSIVVIENITRFMRQGHSRREAAILATKQIALPVLGCTATLIFAFLPILFLPGVPGQFIRSLPLAVVFTILASLLVSLTVVPFLASRFLRSNSSTVDSVASNSARFRITCGPARIPGGRLGATLPERQTRIPRSQMRHQLPYPPDPLQRFRDLLPRLSHTHRAAPHVLKHPALERPATLRAMGVDAAAFPLQRPAWLQEQCAARVIVLDLQPHDLQPCCFARPASSTSANNDPSQHGPHCAHSVSVRLGFMWGR